MSESYTMNLPVINVCMITYNQQDYLERAINSALMQKGDYILRIIIGDDASFDGTEIICEQYARDYPSTITYIRNPYNYGPVRNAINVLSNCKGDYVAFLEGDDYWCDEYKLQKQLDYLINHPECSMVFHAAIVENEEEIVIDHLYQHEGKEIKTIDDLCSRGSYIISTASIMGLNLFEQEKVIDEYGDIWAETHYIGDVFLKSVYLKHGRIGYINEEMSVYHQATKSGGSFSAMPLRRKHELITDSFMTLIDYWSDQKCNYAIRMIDQYEKDDQVFLSVIIPVADFEDNLNNYINSILGYHSEDIEFIFIVKDECMGAKKILADWYARDVRIRYYIQTKGDVSDARNIGFKHIRGQYVSFWDCDDEIDAGAYYRMAHSMKAQNADVGVLNFEEYENGECVYRSIIADATINLAGDESKYCELLFDRFFHYKLGFQVWNKVIDRRLLRNNSIRFVPRRYVCAEDVLFCFACFVNCRKVLCVSEYGYKYQHRKKSLTTSTQLDFKIPAYFRACLFIEKILSNNIILKHFSRDFQAEMLMIVVREDGWAEVNRQLSVIEDELIDVILYKIVSNYSSKKKVYGLGHKHELALNTMQELYRNRQQRKKT